MDDDDKKYGLKPLPEVKPVTAQEAKVLNQIYERQRHIYRRKNPHMTKDEIGNAKRPT